MRREEVTPTEGRAWRGEVTPTEGRAHRVMEEKMPNISLYRYRGHDRDMLGLIYGLVLGSPTFRWISYRLY